MLYGFYGSIYGVDWGEMDPGAKWSFWVIFAFLEEIEQPVIVQWISLIGH